MATSDVSLDNLYEAIIQCFAIILFGYIAGRAGLLTNTQSSGIGTFIAKFCLPALLFKNMCELEFSKVNWNFLVGLFIAKCIVFVVIGMITIFVKRPLNLGYAGLFAIFGTQSNDFALGFPIVQALYGESNPEYLKYIYLAAPISLVLLNPIGFTLMEIHRHRTMQDGSQNSGAGKAILHVIRGVLLNPIVFMTAIGVVGNFVFSSKVPAVLDSILTVLGNAYNASALFYLGLSMVGKLQKLGFGIIVPVLLITAKTLILPLVTWETIGWIEPGGNNTSYSMYGFLYGTFPTAPSVLLYASEYGIGQDIVATGLVLGTFLSAPLMFVSAKMVALMVVTGMDYKDLLMDTSFDVSIISVVCSVWVAGVFIGSGKWKRLPHRFTLALLLSHVIACIGMIAFYACKDNDGAWEHIVITITLLIGVFSTRCWTAVIALVMYLLHVRSLCYVLKKQVWFYFAGFGIPIFTTGLLFIVGSSDVKSEIDPSFHYGSLQTAFSLAILTLSILVTIISLVLWQRIVRHTAPQYSHLPEEQEDRQINIQQSSTDSEIGQGDNGHPRKINGEGNILRQTGSDYQSCGPKPSMKKAPSIEDIVSSSPRSYNGSGLTITEAHSPGLMENVSERTCLLGPCTVEERHACLDRLRAYTADTLMSSDSPQEEELKTLQERNNEEYQTAHHLILLLLLLLSMFIGFILCIWRTFRSEASGIYVEIEFLDCVFNYGQGFLILIVFGFDTKLVFSPLVRRLRRWMYGADQLHLPKPNEVDTVTKHTCQQFTDYHKEHCAKDIVRNRRSFWRVAKGSKFSLYKDVFTGTAMCDWLIRVGLAEDRDQAEAYGKRLMNGGVIRHTSNTHHFSDSRYLYNFVDLFQYEGI